MLNQARLFCKENLLNYAETLTLINLEFIDLHQLPIKKRGTKDVDFLLATSPITRSQWPMPKIPFDQNLKKIFIDCFRIQMANKKVLHLEIHNRVRKPIEKNKSNKRVWMDGRMDWWETDGRMDDFPPPPPPHG